VLFFFQAEDGIRDFHVTGVQTCALPIYDPFWVRLISDDRLVDIASLFVGPDVALFASHYISKPPFTGQPVLWHQDSAFWPLEPKIGRASCREECRYRRERL